MYWGVNLSVEFNVPVSNPSGTPSAVPNEQMTIFLRCLRTYRFSLEEVLIILEWVRKALDDC